MAHDAEQSFEERKLEILMQISSAVEAVGNSLNIIVEMNVKQGLKIDKLEQKMDRILRLSEPRAVN